MREAGKRQGEPERGRSHALLVVQDLWNRNTSKLKSVMNYDDWRSVIHVIFDLVDELRERATR